MSIRREGNLRAKTRLKSWLPTVWFQVKYRHLHVMKTLSDYEQQLDPLRSECPVRAALDVLRGRWKPFILFELLLGARRFCDLQAALPPVTAQALSMQLRQLEADGVVSRKVYPEVPARVEYSLTERGRALSPAMDHLEKWGTEYLANQAASEL